MDELLLLVFLMREKIAVVRFLEEQVLEGIVIFRTYLIGRVSSSMFSFLIMF